MLIRIIMYLFFFCIYCISIISIYIVMNLYYTFIDLIMTAVISNNYYLIRSAISWSVIIFFTCFFLFDILQISDKFNIKFVQIKNVLKLSLERQKNLKTFWKRLRLKSAIILRTSSLSQKKPGSNTTLF